MKIFLFLIRYIFLNCLIHMCGYYLHVTGRRSSQRCREIERKNLGNSCDRFHRKSIIFTLQRYLQKRKKNCTLQFVVNNTKSNTWTVISKRSNFCKSKITPHFFHVYIYGEEKCNPDNKSRKGRLFLTGRLNGEGVKLQESSIQGDCNTLEVSTKRSTFYTNELTKYEKSIHGKNIHAILLCGGIGKRTELATRKQFLKLNDIPLFVYAFNIFIKCNFVKSISLVCDPSYFEHVVLCINMYNRLLLKRKQQHGFLSGYESMEGEEANCEAIDDSVMGSSFLGYLRENRYIIYDNKKGKCIFDMEEMLHDVLNETHVNRVSSLVGQGNERREKRKKGHFKVKPKYIDTNRYKLIRLVKSGEERLDSFLNALKVLDVCENSQMYIYKLLQSYAQQGAEKLQNADYQEGDFNKITNVDMSKQCVLDEHVQHMLPYRNDDEPISKKRYITNILVHDGARPFLSEYDFFNVVYESSLGKNVILGIRATDTIKILNKEEGCKVKRYSIRKTLERNIIFQAQTPQIFKSKTLQKILPYFCLSEMGQKNTKRKKYKNTQFTDTSSILEHFSRKKVYTLQCTFPNFKITTPSDVFQAFFFMKYIYDNSTNIDTNMFKEQYVNSYYGYVLKNQFNNFFFFDTLNEKQKIMYLRFYYNHLHG
ncbi:2-C-methyl-D-erythritol 4-phosphate cytidylyltransferase, putative [Plasmodium ovale]|uniref:2-C-methyl-D-erythritol 4-phosphate cytidylyltransferase, putative n=2 Tax=Plasmodium ovale TaxID=36330 RepID=A0A1D3KWX7_PLAOA|nr:2-C-methyl-D-erythritol 4-phosphate cytidylyltransferase, putative (IspD) [Plasmodium ovale curtisi]SCA48235.1 2-C-methyl-D-erythritol 4-phosphate cytidylyltransferase, putative [Plasmodium ovale]